MPGVCGWIRPCTRTNFKKALCRTRPVGGTYNKYQQVRWSKKITMESDITTTDNQQQQPTKLNN